MNGLNKLTGGAGLKDEMYVSVCMCVCVRVCKYERKRGGERGKEVFLENHVGRRIQSRKTRSRSWTGGFFSCTKSIGSEAIRK